MSLYVTYGFFGETKIGSQKKDHLSWDVMAK